MGQFTGVIVKCFLSSGDYQVHIVLHLLMTDLDAFGKFDKSDNQLPLLRIICSEILIPDSKEI